MSTPLFTHVQQKELNLSNQSIRVLSTTVADVMELTKLVRRQGHILTPTIFK